MHKSPAFSSRNVDPLQGTPRRSTPEVDPDKLSYLRFQSKFRLKSAWDNICEKYGRSFEGVSDEIDLVNDEIIVDRGFVRNTPTKHFGALDSGHIVDDEVVEEAWDSPGCKEAFEETGQIYIAKDLNLRDTPSKDPRMTSSSGQRLEPRQYDRHPPLQ
jgi:Centromere protein Scm3